MSTWIILFHLIFPLSGSAEAEAVRYRGLERMFAKFAAEPE